MDASAWTGYIRQGIRKEVCPDKIRLYLPFFFGGKQEEICLTWDKNGVLSDEGMLFAKLQKRLGDLTPYRERIRNILKAGGPVTLESGHILTVRHAQTRIIGEKTETDYLYGLNRMLRVMSLIAVADTVSVSEDGTVRLC